MKNKSRTYNTFISIQDSLDTQIRETLSEYARLFSLAKYAKTQYKARPTNFSVNTEPKKMTYSGSYDISISHKIKGQRKKLPLVSLLYTFNIINQDEHFYLQTSVSGSNIGANDIILDLSDALSRKLCSLTTLEWLSNENFIYQILPSKNHENG